MLINDSVTVAVEVPVLLSPKNIWHFRKSSRFHIPLHLKPDEVITGHIDILRYETQ